MRVLVTRPAAQAAHWVQRLAAQGIDAVALPLIDIAAPADVAAVERAWARLAQWAMVVFVSPNAAERFFMHRPHAAVWPQAATAAAIGPGTTQTLRDLGVPAQAIVEPAADAPQFDSEALWQRLATQDWAGRRVLVVRGDGGRDWLADTMRRHGAQVEFVAAYRRCAPRFTGDARAHLADALAHPDTHLWFFSSSEAVDHLAQAQPGQAWARSHALATHPRIAACARAHGFGDVRETRPTLESVVACIQSFAS